MVCVRTENTTSSRLFDAESEWHVYRLAGIRDHKGSQNDSSMSLTTARAKSREIRVTAGEPS
jgi:hypothetical protein